MRTSAGWKPRTRQQAFPPNGTQWVIDVPPFAEAAAPLYDHLMHTLAETLGPDRNALFLEFFAETLERQHLGHLGARRRQLRITLEPVNAEHRHYEYQDASILPEGASTTSSGALTMDHMRNLWGELSRHLPPEPFGG